MRKRVFFRYRRQLAAILVSAAILYLISTTAGSSSAQAALQSLQAQGQLALGLLQHQLGTAAANSGFPAPLRVVFAQSAALSAGERAVLSLRRGEETDLPRQEAPPAGQSDHTSPIQESPADPSVPLVIKDNGMPARTLIPASDEGYLINGSVYISNTSDKTVESALFDGSFAARLTEEEGPAVLILHTHGSEAYTLPEGESYIPSGDCRTTDCAYNVVRVGDELAAVLEAAGISVLHDATLHDYPEYSGAYDRSLTTAQAYLEKYPTISMVLDLHRDAITDGSGQMYKVVSTVAGLPAAQMALVIGTDGGGLEHPLWPENLKLAAALQQHLAEKYPTLMRPITVRNSRYNQHLTTGSLLVEVGAAGNSLDEALLSARLLGQALAEVLPREGSS